MKTKLICIIFAAITVIAFIFGVTSDMTIAYENTEDFYSEPALVGMFVTTEYIPRKLDAVLKEFSETDNETGAEHKHKEYVFKGLEGFPFYHCEIKDINGDYGFLHTDGIICDVENIMNMSDETEENKITGTIYTIKTDGIFYANPVYQDKNGNVWLEPGNGMNMADHGSAAIKLGNEIKTTTGGKTKIKKYEAELKIEYAEPVMEIIVSEMDEKDVLIRKTAYTAEEIPLEYTPSENTEYIIVNTVYLDVEGVLQKKRAAFDSSDSDFPYMKIDENGIGIKRCTEILW